MATTIPAMKARFGSTDYFITTMKAGELIQKLRIPKELPEWEDMTIEERFQREINYLRVKKHIAPYLANDDDRFFGALIVDIYNSEGVSFETLGEVLTGVPGLYKQSAQSFGFLHLSGGEVLVPLDGQHRLVAFRFAITGKDEKEKEIKNLVANLDVAKDDVTVILIEHDTKKARKIFNKVNRYAKPTSKAENLITADDDIVAIMTRDVANNMIGERLVNYQSNTLTKTSGQFTTLSTLYDVNMKILEETHGKIDITTLPDPAKQTLYKQEVNVVWNDLLDGGINIFKASLADTSEEGDKKRSEILVEFTIGKPIGQLALVIAYLRLRESEMSDGSKLSKKEILRRLNSLDWRVGNPLWQKVLMNGEKVVAGRQAALFASRFIAYLCGESLHSEQKKALLQNYKNQFGPEEQEKVKLPKAL